MERRLQLQTLLETVLGSRNVYFQPPESVKLGYPCIIYKRSNIDTDFADDMPYIKHKRYQLTIVDSNPDSIIPDKIGCLPRCFYNRHYTVNNLNHDVYNIYF